MPTDAATSSPSVFDLQHRIETLEAELRARVSEQASLTSQLADQNNVYSERQAHQAATNEVLAAMTASPADPQPVFDLIATRARDICGSYGVSVFEFDGVMMHLRAWTGVSDDPAVRDAYVAHFPRLPERTRAEGRAILDAQIVHVRDYPNERELRVSFGNTTVKSNVAVPMRRGTEVIGAVVMGSRDVGGFSDTQVELLKTFAEQAVIAITSAAAHREQREALEQQTATADILKVIASSPTDVQPVLDAVAGAAVRFCGAEDAAITLREGNEAIIVAHTGPLAVNRSRLQLDKTYVRGRVILESRTIHVPDLFSTDDFPAGRQQAQEFGHRAVASAPLLREGEAIGCLSLQKPEPTPYSDRQIQLLEAFAAQAVIAIENVRLFTELRESLEQQIATADILKVIASSPDDVQPVFEAIAERSNKLVDGLSTAVYRLVDDIQHLMSFTPTNPEADAALRALFPSPVSTIFREAVRKGEVFRIADSEVEFVDAPAFRELARLRGWRSVLMVPLLQDRKAIGLITVTRVEPGLFADQHVELLKTFADQAVIAISNVGLFQEVQQRTRELSASLEDLRAAQSRLIQSEKLASLGQLTAGIAHEIKNPLNFVNNFAGLSSELLQELKETMDSAIAALSAETQAEIDEVIDTLSNNLAKIVEHGKRADGIVRGMLEHSRASTGERRSVDLNGLVEEALNLAYHGARAQDQSFSITLKREFGADIAPIELVPQDMTRVFLNLFGNGFYAAGKRQRDGGETSYRPILRIVTRDLGDGVEIRVRDNGTGIAAEVRAKLFQPFFTTKPTGEGTGLGLSISYDVVTQQHGGSIEVESEVGQYTEFTVRLPRARRVAA